MIYFLLLALCIIACGVGSLLYKIAADQIHPIMMSALITSVYFLLIPAAFFFVKFPKVMTLSGSLAAVCGGLCMAIGSLALFSALKRGDAGTTTAVSAIYPAITLLLSVIFLGEKMNVKTGMGIVLALVGVILIGWK